VRSDSVHIFPAWVVPQTVQLLYNNSNNARYRQGNEMGPAQQKHVFHVILADRDT
jgi:hypothetical protein